MDNKTEKFTTRLLSSLTKVFADEPLKDEPFVRASALHNETYSFQVAYYADFWKKEIQVKVESALESIISVRTVGLAPGELVYRWTPDEDLLRTTPGLFPDPLYPITEEDGIVAFPGQWRAVWVTVQLHDQVQAGMYPIHIRFEGHDGIQYGEETFELEVIPVSLPEQKLIFTEWFHTDCLASQYEVDVFSEQHWQIIDRYIETAVNHGVNMILTPIFTPPLDTVVGGERPTVQLVDVWKDGDSFYRFGFDRLQRWITLCQQKGVQYFEFSHLFTQWGAERCPKIVAWEQGELKRIFGWDTEATGEEYRTFLDQFLPQLVQFIDHYGIGEQCYFHISDEPAQRHLEQYKQVSEMLTKHLGRFKIMDALSDYDFYEQGLVKLPIPASDHIEPFIENQVTPLWTYYCVAQYNKVSNRFFNMPSARNRVIGYQFYKFQIAGFLHWGYNFWYSQYSKKKMNPFTNTDAHYAFTAGDSFIVYPGEDGEPIESIRMEVFYEALQDLRALQLLETLIGREEVMELVEQDVEEPITFSEYPRSMEWLLKKRERVNQMIRKASM